MANEVALTVRITPELHRELWECAANSDLSVAQLVRRALTTYLEKEGSHEVAS